MVKTKTLGSLSRDDWLGSDWNSYEALHSLGVTDDLVAGRDSIWNRSLLQVLPEFDSDTPATLTTAGIQLCDTVNNLLPSGAQEVMEQLVRSPWAPLDLWLQNLMLNAPKRREKLLAFDKISTTVDLNVYAIRDELLKAKAVVAPLYRQPNLLKSSCLDIV